MAGCLQCWCCRLLLMGLLFRAALAVVPVPPHVAPAAASTLPTVFLTAHACLGAAAAVQPGQTVLIHAATGEAGRLQQQWQRLRSTCKDVLVTAWTTLVLDNSRAALLPAMQVASAWLRSRWRLPWA